MAAKREQQKAKTAVIKEPDGLARRLVRCAVQLPLIATTVRPASAAFGNLHRLSRLRPVGPGAGRGSAGSATATSAAAARLGPSPAAHAVDRRRDGAVPVRGPAAAASGLRFLLLQQSTR